jgi:hypothetical protein
MPSESSTLVPHPVQDQQDACREVERMPELSEVTPDMSPADVRRLIVQRGGTIPAEEALVQSAHF